MFANSHQPEIPPPMTSFQSYPKHPPLPPPKPYEPSRRMPQDSPTQPAHQNQLHFPSADSIPAPPAGNAQPRPPMSHQTHSRSSSFFSFLSTKNSQDPQNQHQPSPHRKLSRNTSASASGTRQNAMPQTQHQQQQSHQLQHPSPPMPQQQPSTTTAAPNSPSVPGASPSPKSPSSSPLHPEIRSLVSLTIAHAHKIYFSGPLIRRIERQPDGQKPVKDDGWTEVWAQLGGTTLSIWDMKEIQEASQKGEEVPPAYINITDAVSVPLVFIMACIHRLTYLFILFPPFFFLVCLFSLCKCLDQSLYPRLQHNLQNDIQMSSRLILLALISYFSLARQRPHSFHGPRH